MITVTTKILNEGMRVLAMSNCIGSIIETNEHIEFRMTDKMFKPFYEQSKAILGYNGFFTDQNTVFKFHDDKYPLLS